MKLTKTEALKMQRHLRMGDKKGKFKHWCPSGCGKSLIFAGKEAGWLCVRCKRMFLDKEGTPK